MLTFEELKSIEPELADLEAEICSLATNFPNGFDPMRVWYRWGDIDNSYKTRISRLVGWSRNRMRTDPGQAPVPDHNGCLTSHQLAAWPEISNPRFHPKLCSPRAYDVAYQHLYNLLCEIADSLPQEEEDFDE